ncbi:ECF subfamily RNA polymerase sigma factor, BldN family [Glycomyces buryatensis]|nr:ECF subfamily RNA polymerase sigma factor, BldN family [Glycomyces buryatensis]
MPGIAPTLTTHTAPFLRGSAFAGVLSSPETAMDHLRQVLWTVMSLNTGTAEQHSVGAGSQTPVAGASPGTSPGKDTEDQADGEEVAQLVARAQDGDASAFGEIYDRYNETVYRYIYFRVNNAQLAEDLASETFLRALRRISSFSWQGRAFGAWLVTIARNLVVDHFKSGRYRLEIAKPDVLGADTAETDPSTSPETAALEKLTNATLLTAVKKLNPDQQECIVLRFLQGFTVAETARTMGKNEGAVKALQYRAVRTLARLLPDGFRG